MKSLTVTLSEGEARFILESLFNEEKRLRNLCAINSDKDIAVDYANDLATLTLVLDQFRERAVSVFGESILNFSRKEL